MENISRKVLMGYKDIISLSSGTEGLFLSKTQLKRRLIAF